MGHQQQPYGYRDFTTTASGANMQTFGDTGGHDLFGLQTGMEMLAMAPPSKDSPSHVMMMPVSADVTTLDHGWQQNRLIVDEDDSSLRCLFPIQDSEDNNNHNHNHNQGLSLTLISNTHQTSPHHNHDHHHLGLLKQSPSPSSSSYNNNSTFHQYYPASYELRSSVYLMPAQELLNEFCNFGGDRRSPIRQHKWRKLEEDDSSLTSTLLPMDPLSLQRHKSKLLSMLEEVDRRYKRYCEQMRGVVSSFEAVAGEGSAAVYSAMASKAMSRHFRCLRDGIVGQIRATKKAMGEKDPVAPGTTRGETPRLKVLDQCIRQQKAFQQGVESHQWRPQRGLPERSVSILRAWLFEHFLHPYPSDVDKHILARQTGLSRSQVSNWFINARVRLWKPMVEEMYVEETKGNSDSNDDDDDSNNSYQPNTQNPNPNVGATTTTSPTSQLQDQKPQLHIEPDSLSSIVSKRMPTENLKVVDLDFASYSNYDEGSFGNGVSLTLGLQQHSGGGMCLSFSPASQQSLFFSREQILEEEQNLPYRKLMGAQLLHDFAG